MIAPIGSYTRKARRTLRVLVTDPRTRLGAKLLGSAVTGFLLSAASLCQVPMPVAMAFVCCLTGLPGLSAAVGATLGYWVFWGNAGFQGMIWSGLAMASVLVFTRWPLPKGVPYLTEAIAGLICAGTGLAFQVWLADTTPVPIYLLRIALGALCAALFSSVLTRKTTLNHTLAEGLGVLALAQVAITPWLNLGFLAAGLIGCWDAFPAAALAGLALDLAQVTPVPMTAVLCLCWLVRLSPRGSSILRYLAPGAVYLLVMGLCGQMDFYPIPCLALGGLLARALPERPEITVRRGQTGTAQVRLELAANVLTESRQLLLETNLPPIDEEALIKRAKDRSCGSCPARKACRQKAEALSPQLLRRPLVDSTSLPFSCRKPTRLLSELRRSQEQLRTIKADRDRQGEYRAAVNQQYQFLSAFLRQLSDQLPRRADGKRQRYQVDVTIRSHSREASNGDKCLSFPGTMMRHYVLLCDGMGTGMGAAQDAQTAAGLLRRLLSAGFPAEYALRSLNSLCVLRGRAGAVTVDLAEVCMATGKAVIYKWGAAPSWLLRDTGAEKIGTATPPPGLSVTDAPEAVERLSLRQGETLILCSDGVIADTARRGPVAMGELPSGELAAAWLTNLSGKSEDDATVAVIRLKPLSMST